MIFGYENRIGATVVFKRAPGWRNGRGTIVAGIEFERERFDSCLDTSTVKDIARCKPAPRPIILASASMSTSGPVANCP